MNLITVLFPIDLYEDLSYLENSKVFLVEESHYFDRMNKKGGFLRFNVLKPIYHRATMREYFDNLIAKKIDCDYIEFNEDWISTVIQYSKKHNALIQFFDPVDRYIEMLLWKNFDQYDIINTPRFISTVEDLEQYDGVLRQTSFYAWIRKRNDILIDKKTGKYEMNKLTFDSDNRKKPYDGMIDDLINESNYNNNIHVKEAFNYVKKNIPKNHLYVWENDFDKIELKFPINSKIAKKHLNQFIEQKLTMFGDYQDAFLKTTSHSLIFHSGISPMLNIGLLTPFQVIESVISFYNKTKIKKSIINDVEGFIRQIIGWREFCRYLYQSQSKMYLNKNFFRSNNSLSADWYTANVGILPIDRCIEKAFRYGYLHHIERLMVIANYMTLTHIDPKAMYKWFMEFSIDSYDWVMEYNIYSMGSYSDGGKFTTKPYISSSNYLLKMSDYEKKESSEWSDLWDTAFWKFMDKHKDKIKKIPRLSGLIKHIKNHIT